MFGAASEVLERHNAAGFSGGQTRQATCTNGWPQTLTFARDTRTQAVPRTGPT